MLQNNAKLRKWSKYNELHRFHVKTNKNVELRLKPFRTTQNYKRDQITMNLHRYDVKKIENVELRRKTFKTAQYYETDQSTMNCIDWTSKRSKQRKTPKVIKIPWIGSIWCQNDQNNAKLQKRSNYDKLHGFNVRTIRTTQNSKSDEITMNCIDLTSKRLKQRKTTNAIKQRWICIHSTSKRPKCWVTTQNIQNNAKLEKWPKYHELHRFDDKTIITTQNYESYRITMNCIDLTTKR